MDTHCELLSIKSGSILRFIESNFADMLESWAKRIEVSKFTMVNSLISAKEAACNALPVNHRPKDAHAWEFEISHPHFLKIRAHVVCIMSIILSWRG